MYIEKKTSVATLSIHGTSGKFSVGKGKNRSTNVKYILTNIHISSTGGVDQKLLEVLKPVREVFKLQDLDFDQIMQRDLNDCRVSSELIPYLLESGNSGLVKLFPPIVIVVIPRKEGLPQKYYKKLIETEEAAGNDGYKKKIMCFGDIGAEQFVFNELVKPGGEIDRFNYNSLSINPSNTELVIVDGQHRAMALIALFRNLNSWPAGSPYKKFYEEWSSTDLKEYDLKGVELPAIICTFPELHDGSEKIDGLDVMSACRSIFLALNKHAMSVSNSRNILLDDYDLTSSFLRSTLSQIKAMKNESENVRLWCVELDNTEDKTKLESDVAITGVMPLYNIIETIMFHFHKLEGLNKCATSPTLRKNNKLHNFNNRMGLNLYLEDEILSCTNRNIFKKNIEEKYIEVFNNSFRVMFVYAFSILEPYKIHNEEFSNLKTELEASSPIMHMVLFEGQGMQKVLKKYRDKLKDKIGNKNLNVSQEVKSSHAFFQEFILSLDNDISTKFQSRNIRINSKSQRNSADEEAQWIKQYNTFSNSLFKDVFGTSAFQTALFLTFIDIYEKKFNNFSEKENVINYFREYIQSLNEYFGARDLRMIQTFVTMEVSDDVNIRKRKTLKKLLIDGEMNPKEWVKLRFIFLELWLSSDEEINQLIASEVDKSRNDLMNNTYQNNIKNYLDVHNLDHADLKQKFRDEIQKNTVNEVQVAIKILRSKHGAPKKRRVK